MSLFTDICYLCNFPYGKHSATDEACPDGAGNWHPTDGFSVLYSGPFQSSDICQKCSHRAGLHRGGTLQCPDAAGRSNWVRGSGFFVAPITAPTAPVPDCCCGEPHSAHQAGDEACPDLSGKFEDPAKGMVYMPKHPDYGNVMGTCAACGLDRGYHRYLSLQCPTAAGSGEYLRTVFAMSVTPVTKAPGFVTVTLISSGPTNYATTVSVSATPALAADKVDDRWPHTCYGCGGPAYVGLRCQCKKSCRPEFQADS